MMGCEDKGDNVFITRRWGYYCYDIVIFHKKSIQKKTKRKKSWRNVTSDFYHH